MARKKVEANDTTEQGVFLRGAKEFRHDLFKSDVQKMKRNVSFKKDVIQIVELEHSHIFHSHNSQGRPQEYTSTVGGHFHAVTISKDPQTGRPSVTCGPAMREVHVKRPNGVKRVKQPVEWEGYDSNGNHGKMGDAHSHSFEYEGSEVLSDRKVRALQAKTQAAVGDALPEIRAQQAAGQGDDDFSLQEMNGDE